MLGVLYIVSYVLTRKEGNRCLLGLKIARGQETRSAPPVGAGFVIGRMELEKKNPSVARQVVTARRFSADTSLRLTGWTTSRT